MNLANKLTILRVAIIPFFIATFYIPWKYWYIISTILFITSFITDMLDGKIARKRDQVTNFGKFMDPIADKILTVSAMIMLVSVDLYPPIAALIVVSREFFVSGLRMVVASEGTVIAASWLGKTKTISQFIAICLVLLHNPIFGLINIPLDTIAIWVSTALTIWSGCDYLFKNRKSIDHRK